jgi:twitching motility protein PilT
MRFAIAAADTGHLVFATVHTTSVDSAVDRLIGSFPPGEQQQIRSSLSTSLRAVVCQMLLPRLDGKGRILALEILLNNEAVASLIRKAKAYQIPSLIATSREQGMRLMDHDLARLVREKKVSLEEAMLKARNRKDVEQLLGIAPTPMAALPGQSRPN